MTTIRQSSLHDLLQSGEIRDNQIYQIANNQISNSGLGEVVLVEAWYSSLRTHAVYAWLRQVAAVVESKALNKEAFIFGENYEHNTKDPFILIDGASASTFTLKTGNLVGFIRFQDREFKISSRFGNLFLKYIIADADGFKELDQMGSESPENDFLWLLAYLWNTKFRKACRLGLPKTYEGRHERLVRPRGNVDPVDFWINGESGKYACAYREHSFRNPTTSLIVAAYESLTKSKSRALVNHSRPQYLAFAEAVGGLKVSRSQLMAVKSMRNPFYKEFDPVIELSKLVLRQKGLGIGSDNQASGYLFDVSMLFEYFIRKLLQRTGFSVLPKSKRERVIPNGHIGHQHALQPDLLIEAASGLAVFDVKYKSFDPGFGCKREDLFQLHTYVGQFSNQDTRVSCCGFIYPMRQSRWEQIRRDHQSYASGFHISSFQQQSQTVKFILALLPVPDKEMQEAESPTETTQTCEDGFSHRMETACNGFVETLKAASGMAYTNQLHAAHHRP